MARCSADLRERVVAAVDGGMSRREAAERSGVSAASAVRWMQQKQRTGTVRPGPRGGDKRSHRIEAHAGLIFARWKARRDISLEERRAALAGRGVAVAGSTLRRFFRRHGTLKAFLRKAAARTVPSLERAIADAIDAFTPRRVHQLLPSRRLSPT